MAIPPCVFDGLNVNDGVVYTILPGVELGARQKTWSERKSYTGVIAQYNVSDAASIPMRFPMLVEGLSPADLDAKVQAINTKIDGCSSVTPKNLVYGGMTYQIVTTSRVAYIIDQREQNSFVTKLDLVLNRLPDISMVTLNQNMVAAPPVNIETFANAADWSLTSATLTADTTRHHYGTQSLNLTCTSAGVTGRMTKPGMTLDLSDKMPVRFWAHFPAETDYRDISKIEVRFVTSHGNDYYYATLWVHQVGTAERFNNGSWQSWLLSPTYFATWGTPDWSNIVEMEVSLHPLAGKTPTILCGLAEHVNLQGAIMFDYDDSRENVYLAGFPVLSARGVRANVYTITGQMGAANFMTWTELQTLDAADWSICNHGQWSIDQSASTYAQNYDDVHNAVVDLTAHGLSRNALLFAYPQGYVGTTSNAALTAAGILQARISGDMTPSMPFADPYLTWCHSVGAADSSAVTLAKWTGLIDEVKLYGGVARLCCHVIGAGLDLEVADLTTLRDYAIASGLPIITNAELQAATTGPVLVPDSSSL
jgi:hypothetical protein